MGMVNKMISKSLALYKFYEDNYISPKISLEEIVKMCEQANTDYFQIKMKQNVFKTINDKKPDYVFWVMVDLKNSKRGNPKDE